VVFSARIGACGRAEIADEDMYRAKLEHRKLQAPATNQPEGAAYAA
jgi:hypothetical protein